MKKERMKKEWKKQAKTENERKDELGNRDRIKENTVRPRKKETHKSSSFFWKP